ncbi:WXG100 family type VII secretion target [Streptomyces sp. NPDC048637]|uniref:WXG100 family type VII secretion target n=1 Tax=Streptomyces sp. NPDC048637 TaxID=3155636 RepID=UPI00342BCD6C
MSDDESVAEKVFEVGIEAINPGGRPDVLRAAAAGWRSLAHEAEEMFSKLDREVKGTVGETWRGPAAEAFQNHWKQLKSAIDDTTGEFEECAKGLDEAAKSIEEINDEIHGIYAEIGISVAVSAATSLFSFGLSTAAGAARVAQLASRAVAAAGRLGVLLQRVASVFRTLYAGRKGKIVLDALANWAGGTAGGVATSVLSGKGPEWRTNALGGLGGATLGTGAGKVAENLMGNRVGKTFVTGAAGGAAGGVTGDALDAAFDKEKEFDPASSAITAVTGAAAGGGAAEGVSFQRAFDIRPTHAGRDLAQDVAMNSAVPVFGGPAGNDAKDGVENVSGSSDKAQAEAKKRTDGLGTSGTDRIEDVFG